MGNAYLGLYQQDKDLYHLEKALDLTVEHEPTPRAIGRAYILGTAFQALNELDKVGTTYCRLFQWLMALAYSYHHSKGNESVCAVVYPQPYI